MKRKRVDVIPSLTLGGVRDCESVCPSGSRYYYYYYNYRSWMNECSRLFVQLHSSALWCWQCNHTTADTRLQTDSFLPARRQCKHCEAYKQCCSIRGVEDGVGEEGGGENLGWPLVWEVTQKQPLKPMVQKTK